jgi:hypothetical protein
MSATLGGFVMKAMARAVSGPKFLARTIGVATLSVAQSLTQLVHEGLATDIKEMKDSLITSAKAEADLKKHKATQAFAKAKADMAKAEKVIADAEKAVNETNIKKRIEQSKLLEAEQEQI